MIEKSKETPTGVCERRGTTPRTRESARAVVAPKLSVILSTYEKPRELRLALQSLLEAPNPESGWFELVIADDGSETETAQIIAKFATTAPFRVTHIHQEDRGFRLARIRNKAIRAAKGEVIFFVDGDSLIHPQALETHASSCTPGTACAGTRYYLDESTTRDLLEGRISVSSVHTDSLRRGRWRRRRDFVMNAIYRKTGLKPDRPKLIGGNCSVQREDLERVNGFDERFVGWGREDDDLARRLRKSGVQIRDVRLKSVVVHLHHPPHPSHQPSVHHTANYAYFHRGFFLTCCRQGLESRTLQDIRFELRGEFPESLDALQGELGEAREGAPAEVLVISPREHRPTVSEGQHQIVLQLPESVLCADVDPLAESRHFLENAL